MPKVNPNYPDTARLGPEMPLNVLVRKLDKRFDVSRRTDLAYDYGDSYKNGRNFRIATATSGAYETDSYDFNSDFNKDFSTLESATLIDNGWGD